MGVSAWGSSPDPDICNIDMRVICANIKITDIREPVKKSVENSTLGGGGPDRVIFHTFLLKIIIIISCV